MEEITDQNNASAIDFPLTASNKCEIKAMNLIICILKGSKAEHYPHGLYEHLDIRLLSWA